MSFRALGLVLLLSLTACRRSEAPRAAPSASASATPAQRPEIATALATLRSEEEALRARTDFATLLPSSRALGANPYALIALPRTPGRAQGELEARYVGLLRGDGSVVALDGRLNELGSAPAPKSSSALALGPGGDIFVVGPLAQRIARYRTEHGSLDELPSLALPSDAVPRALAGDQRTLVVADFAGDRLFFATASDVVRASAPGAPALRGTPTCRGPIRLALTPRWLAVACLFDHAIVLYRREREVFGPEVLRITHDGPFFGLSLLEDGAELLIGAGGVEDHPLERKDKVFGYIDSFAYLYRLRQDGALSRLLAANVSEFGVVTPKIARLERRNEQLWFTLIGYGSDRWVELAFDAGVAKPPRAVVHAGVPGCADAVLEEGNAICANPLFDAWVELSEPAAVRAARPRDASDPVARTRLGEALFFTTLMAPDASSEGRLSRFTCETCHFEGGTDGRVHHSGRAAIRVSTRPLFGLLNAAPHFSRAHDPDLTSVSHNEFSVANRGNPVDPWFSLEPERFPWLAELGVPGASIAPLDLRRALLEFLGRFSHEENPAALARAERRFTSDEALGAALFRKHCERCHSARLIANDDASTVAPERWESLVLSDQGPIVWSSGRYEQTGVEPYVERRGTRVPSLRRLYEKRPYLTNGSATSLAALLELVRFSPTAFFHGAAPSGLTALDPAERAALLTFLRLL
jgi:hypothetical protein